MHLGGLAAGITVVIMASKRIRKSWVMVVPALLGLLPVAVMAFIVTTVDLVCHD